MVLPTTKGTIMDDFWADAQADSASLATTTTAPADWTQTFTRALTVATQNALADWEARWFAR